jgi:putative DNA primase/helicase
MNAVPDELPRRIRTTDERTERDLAVLDRTVPPKAIPTRSTLEIPGDTGDNGDTASDNALPCPHPDPAAGDSGDRAVPLARFERLNRWTDGRAPGVYWIGTTQNKQTGEVIELPPVWICSPLTVAAQTRDPQSSEWGRLLVFQDNDRREHRWAMPMRMLAGSGEELRGELLSEGLVITSHPNDRRRVADYIAREKTDVMARCVSRTGWHGDVFVLPRETFGDSDAEPVIFQTTALDGVALGQGGTLAGWIEQVAKPCAGHSRLVLALSCAFAGPCIGLLGVEGGGVHLRGPSSCGKTTAARVVASVYGSPAFVRTWRQTDNALEGVAALHSDLLLVLDEIGQLDPKHAGAVAYLLANGQGKGRSRRDGSPRAPSTWRVLFLSTGEVGLSDLVTQAGGKARAGQEVRVLDLSADAGAGFGLFDRVPEGLAAGAFADRLQRSAATHYGHALPAFVRALVIDPDRARETLRAMRDALARELAGDEACGQVRRVADRFALIAAAGELATAYRVTGWNSGEAESAIRTCFAAWLAARGTKGAAEPSAMIAQVRAFLEAHGESRFTAWDARDDGRTVNRAGFRRHTPDGPEYYVEREAFRRELAQGFDPAQVARVLVEAGALIGGGDGRLDSKVRLPDGRNARVYRIGPRLWDDAP